MVLSKRRLKKNIIQEPTSQQSQVLSLKAMSLCKIKRKKKTILLLQINIQELIKTTLKKVNTMITYKFKLLKTRMNNKKITNLKECYIRKLKRTLYKKVNTI